MAMIIATNRNLPVTDNMNWDGAAAQVRIFRWAGFDGDNPDPDKAKQAFLYYDSSQPNLKGSYHFPIADVQNGRLVIPSGALGAAAGYLPKAKGISEGIRNRARAILDHYYQKRDKDKQGSNGGSEKALHVRYPWHRD